MTDRSDDITEHYSITGLGERIFSALVAAGKDLDKLTIDDLAPVDEFHIRGRQATEELAEWANIQSGQCVLDVGCGLGGTSRYLADSRSCNVIGIDLTEEYCRVAHLLSSKMGMTDRTTFHQASALELPLNDEQFDVVWTEHVQMNIADKIGFYSELARVTKTGGQLAFHDIFAGPGGDIHFPVPWAADDSISHLIPVEELEATLKRLGLRQVYWEDKTDASIAFFREVVERSRQGGPPPIGLHLLMGDEAKIKFANVLRNLEENRIRVVQAVMQRV